MITRIFASKHGSICKSKIASYRIVFGYRAKNDNSELGIVSSNRFHTCVIEKFRRIVFALYMKAITRTSLEFPELLLWPDTQSFDIQGIPPRLEVLPLTQKYQTQRKDFDSKMPDRCLYVCSVRITFLRLNQITLQPKFDFNNSTCIYTSIYSVMFYYFGGDLKND